MLTKTSRSAIRTLLYLGLHVGEGPQSPRLVAQQLGESPTYLAKVVRHLTKAGILRAHRGVSGGVELNRTPDEISLLAIVEACQGVILGAFCTETDDLSAACAFHQAGAELHQAIVGVLSCWTLAQFLRKPRHDALDDKSIQCWLEPCSRVQVPAAKRRSERKPDRPTKTRRRPLPANRQSP